MACCPNCDVLGVGIRELEVGKNSEDHGHVLHIGDSSVAGLNVVENEGVNCERGTGTWCWRGSSCRSWREEGGL